MKDIHYIADLLDTKFKLPNGWRFGIDGILGLIPGLGNIITDTLSFYILVRAAILGCSPSVLLHMTLNVLIDNLLDKIPILGLIFDFIWKSNSKNIALLDSFLIDPSAQKRQSTTTLVLTLIFLLVAFGACIALTVYTVAWALYWIVKAIPG